MRGDQTTSPDQPTRHDRRRYTDVNHGKTAGQLADERETPVVLFDLCADYAHASAIAISCAAQNDAQHNAKAIRLLQSLGKQVIPLPDYPGLLTMRTAMLANEALDVVNKGVASAEDTDLAMLRGVNYPRGPLARGAALGWRHILATLENLQRYYGEARYRPMPLLRRYASPPLSREPNDERQYAARAGSALRRTDVSARYLRSGDGDAHRCRRRRIRSGQHDSRPADAQRPPDLPQRPAVQPGGHRLRLRLQQPGWRRWPPAAASTSSARRWPAIASPPARRCAIRAKPPGCMTSKSLTNGAKPSHGSAAARTASATAF